MRKLRRIKADVAGAVALGYVVVMVVWRTARALADEAWRTYKCR
jgi:hypothetical protein